MERRDKILLYLFFQLEEGHLCGGQRTTIGSRFSPITWIPGIELRLTRLGNRCPHPCDILKAWVLKFTMEDSFSSKHYKINVVHSIKLKLELHFSLQITMVLLSMSCKYCMKLILCRNTKRCAPYEVQIKHSILYFCKIFQLCLLDLSISKSARTFSHWWWKVFSQAEKRLNIFR